MNTWVQSPILLVEDNPVDLDLTLRAFRKKRFANEIQVARDGEEALGYMARWAAGEPWPAVILLDIQLPKVGGLEVLRAWKAHEQFRRIPVVILTSSREDRDLKEAYDLGVNSYIEKPVSFSKFMEVADQIELYWCVLNERPGS
jgi:CheY-like chemotaxis protein